jgi:hypothetical protein
MKKKVFLFFAVFVFDYFSIAFANESANDSALNCPQIFETVETDSPEADYNVVPEISDDTPINLPQIAETRTGFYAFYPNGITKFFSDKGLIKFFSEVSDASHLAILRRQIGVERLNAFLSSASGLNELRTVLHNSIRSFESPEERQAALIHIQEAIERHREEEPLDRNTTAAIFQFLQDDKFLHKSISGFVKTEFAVQIASAKAKGENFKGKLRYVDFEIYGTPKVGSAQLIPLRLVGDVTIHQAIIGAIDDTGFGERFEYVDRGFVNFTVYPGGNVKLVSRAK